MKTSLPKFLLVTSIIVLLVGYPFFTFVYFKAQPDHYSLRDMGSSESTSEEQAEGAKSQTVQRVWYLDAESRPFRILTQAAVFSAACVFGTLGASISLVRRFNIASPTPDFFCATTIIGSELVGATFAGVLALLFAGRIVQGELFPNTNYETWYTIIYIPSEFSKLLVWTFIAGFSEKKVPELLHSMTENLRDTFPKGEDKK